MLSVEPSEPMVSVDSEPSSTGGCGATLILFELFLVPRFAAFLVVFFAAFLVVFFAALRALPFFVDFLAAFLVDFLAPPREADLAALLFFVPLPPPLREPLDFLVPFLATISLAPLLV